MASRSVWSCANSKDPPQLPGPVRTSSTTTEFRATPIGARPKPCTPIGARAVTTEAFLTPSMRPSADPTVSPMVDLQTPSPLAEAFPRCNNHVPRMVMTHNEWEEDVRMAVNWIEHVDWF